MVTCPRCGFNNDVHAIVCLRCYLLMGGPIGDQPSTSTVQQAEGDPQNDSPLPQERTRPPTALDKYSIGLYIGNLPAPVILQIVNTAYLGRRSGNIKVYPLLDLSPFGGGEAGVSRLHAAIHRVRNGMAIEDLKSVNGVWLNGVRLAPNKRMLLHTGDQVRLSKLAIEILTHESE